MTLTRVLVIEDDLAIRRGLCAALASQGFDALESGDGTAGLGLLRSRGADLVLLDLVLPGADGLDVLREIRAHDPVLPVIILTARGSEDDRVKGLSSGADDYVVKPFSVRELLARVESVLRRSPERTGRAPGLAALSLPGRPGAEVDLLRGEVRFGDGDAAPLTPLEVDLLRYLAAHPDRATSREELLQRVWNVNPRCVETRSVDMAIARLRKKLRDDEAPVALLQTARGKGYKLGR
jgi:DNA-binding response OmpR family regulator